MPCTKSHVPCGIRMFHDKITSLEQLIASYPQSMYITEAEQIANTYLMIETIKKRKIYT